MIGHGLGDLRFEIELEYWSELDILAEWQNHAPSRHFSGLPYSKLVPRLLTGVASDWYRIGVICADVTPILCRSSFDG